MKPNWRLQNLKLSLYLSLLLYENIWTTWLVWTLRVTKRDGRNKNTRIELIQQPFMNAGFNSAVSLKIKTHVVFYSLNNIIMHKGGGLKCSKIT